VKGSHVVLPKLYEGEHAFILQNDDRRVVFMIPYGDVHTLVGTTDVPVQDEAARPEARGEGRQAPRAHERASAHFPGNQSAPSRFGIGAADRPDGDTEGLGQIAMGGQPGSG